MADLEDLAQMPMDAPEAHKPTEPAEAHKPQPVTKLMRQMEGYTKSISTMGADEKTKGLGDNAEHRNAEFRRKAAAYAGKDA